MHADDVAALYGFRGGLVPGVDVFGYLCDAFEAAEGIEWRSQGWGELRLIRPFYDGESVVVRGEPSMGAWALSAEGEDGGVRATLRVGVRNTTAVPVDVERRELPVARLPVSEDSLEPGTVLGSISRVLQEASPRELLECANRILMANFELEPWIHTASKLQWFAAPQVGDTMEVRGVIEDLFARKGHSMVRYAVAYATERGPLMHVVHTAIWRLQRTAVQ